MSDTTLPDPLVPAEVDLRDFGFMPLHVQRLRDSELVDLSTGDEFKAAVLLWAFAWHQQPAASLPNDDRILAARSGAGSNWRKVKAMALRGFVACSDGRLYHPLIAEAALDAWARREGYQTAQDAKETRQQRWRAELARLSALLRAAGVTPPQRPTKGQLLDLCKRHGVDAGVDACETLRDTSRETRLDAGEVAKTGTGTETINTERAATVAVAPPVAARAPEPDTQGHEPTPAGRVCRAMRAAGLSQTNPGDPRLLALLQQGATEAEFVGLAQEARAKGKGWAWVLVTLQARRQEAAAITLAPVASPPVTVSSDAAERTQDYLAEQAQHQRGAPPRELLERVGKVVKPVGSA